MKRIISGKIIISFLVFILLGTITYIYFILDNTTSVNTIGPDFHNQAEDIIKLDGKQKNALKHEIKVIHTDLNLAIGYDMIPTENHVSSLLEKANNLEQILALEITYTPLVEDLEELLELLKNVKANERNLDWVLAHRIAHDLDYYLLNPELNPRGNGNPFGVTRTLPALAEDITG